MRVGDVVTTGPSLTVYQGRSSFGFKAPAGHRFVVLVLGTEPKDGSAPLDGDAVLRQLGWVPEAEAPKDPGDETCATCGFVGPRAAHRKRHQFVPATPAPREDER